MNGRPKGMSEAEFVALTTLMLERGNEGAFDANEALALVLDYDVLETPNAWTVVDALDDLVDLGELQRMGRTEGDGPQRYQLARRAGGSSKGSARSARRRR